MTAPNPIAEYKESRKLNLTALAVELGISKGHASDLVNGKERVGMKVASRMQKLTGRPWHDFLAPPRVPA